MLVDYPVSSSAQEKNSLFMTRNTEDAMLLRKFLLYTKKRIQISIYWRLCVVQVMLSRWLLIQTWVSITFWKYLYSCVDRELLNDFRLAFDEILFFFLLKSKNLFNHTYWEKKMKKQNHHCLEILRQRVSAKFSLKNFKLKKSNTL